jgi:hypothetical protein
MTRNTITFVLLVALSLLTLYERRDWFFQQSGQDQTVSVDQLKHAFENEISNLQVEGRGVVKAILRDDTKGSKHQRIIVALPTGQSVLVAHNIDLAPRVENLNKGDAIAFFGEYEWNPRGGVIHWTHHDPRNKHVAGWLKHNGRLYR